MPGVKASELSAASFTRFRQLAARSGRLDAAALAESDGGLLDKLKLTEGAYLKRAAVLLFHADPLRYVTGAFVKIGFFHSPSDLAYHDEVAGDLFWQSQQTLDLLLTKYLKAAITYEGIQRIERFPVPRSALREVVLNALLHRDYAVGAPIQIRVYEDRLTLWNPAVLPEGWTSETLRRRHVSHPFNPEIANVFFRAGEIEAWGRGIERIFGACRDEGVPEPLLTYEGNDFSIEFAFAETYLNLIAGDRHTAHRRTRREVTDPVADLVADPVDQVLQALANGPAAPSAIQARVGLKHRPTFRANYLRPALAQGLITMTIPGKPSSRLQRYRLTPSGQARLEALRSGR